MTRHLPLNALCEECRDAAELHAPGRCLAEGCTCAGFVFQGVVAIDTFAGATVVERVGVPMPGRRAEVSSITDPVKLEDVVEYAPRRAREGTR